MKFTSLDAQILPEDAQRQAGRRRAASRVPALPRHPDPRAGREPRPGRRRDGQKQLAHDRGHRPGQPAASGSRTATSSCRRSTTTRTSTRRAATSSRRCAACPTRPAATVLVTGATANFVDFQESLKEHLPIADRDHRPRDPDRALPDDGIGGAAGEAAGDERAQPDRGLRDPRLHLPGRPARGAARLPQPGRAGADDADPAVRARVRPLDRLRRLPALADQGGPRQRRQRLGVRRRSAWRAPAAS